MKIVTARCYPLGSVTDEPAEDVLATLRNILYVAGFQPISELESDRHCSMRNVTTGIDVTLSVEDD